MSTAPNQLAEIYRQLTERFSSHKAIYIEPIKGDPPDRYEITYNIKGLSKAERGDVVETTSHVIELSIPFGFPHFPPTCKPKSNIFHPDFDPAVICLGDFWHQDCSLPDLILFIGQMINGEVYSKTDAFNEEACLWYNKHSDAFPLTKIEWREIEPASELSRKYEVDTLDESDLSTEFDFLAIEEEEKVDSSPNDPPPASPSAPTFDPDLINLLEKQKRYFALCQYIKKVESINLPEEINKLFREAEKITRQAENLFRESQMCEKRSDIHGAYAALRKITDYTDDFPDFEVHAIRLRQILTDWENNKGQEKSTASTTDQLGEEDNVAAPAIGKKIKKPRPADKKSAVPTFKWNKKLIAYLLGGSSAILLASCGYYYWITTAKLGSAEAAFSVCTALLEKSQFKNAKQSCEEARTVSDGIKYIHHDRVEQLRTQIDKVLQSERMSQGLKGMILVDGKYLAQKDVEILERFSQLRKEAEEFYAQGDWQSSTERFTQILEMPVTQPIIPADVVDDVQAKLAIAQFRLVYDSGLRSLHNNKLQEAISELIKAEGLLNLLPEGDRQLYLTDLKNSLAKGTFEQSLEQGDLFFAKSEWRNAVAAYELALSIPGIEALPKESSDMIQSNIKRAELYDLIDQGIKAFGDGAWDEAIGEYRRAEEFLASHQTHLNVADAEKSSKKLSRIILQALIVRNRQLAAGHLEKNELSVARNIYRQLINHIDNSQFSGEGEFLTNRKELAATIQSLDEKIFIAEKSKHLENEYRQLFAANYPTAVAENLVKPVISFSKDTGDKAIFKMQCTESGGGRPVTLVMYYAFDKKNGQWELYSEQQ